MSNIDFIVFSSILITIAVRNSWGPYWGNEGYIYLGIGDNVCGLANEATIPKLA